MTYYKNIVTGQEGTYQAPPDGGSEDWVEMTQEEIDANCLECLCNSIIKDATSYLNMTDWFIVREADSGDGTTVPSEITTDRTKARTNINSAETATTTAELEALDTTYYYPE